MNDGKYKIKPGPKPKHFDVYGTAKIVIRGKTVNTNIADFPRFRDSWNQTFPGLHLDEKVIIGDYVFVALDDFIMHRGAQIAPHACLSGGGMVRMYSNSVVGFGAQLITGTDTTKGKFMCEAATKSQRKIVSGSITLKVGAYIGSGAIICVSQRCPDIVIGKNSVVGTGTYIDRSIPDDTIVHPVQNLLWSARVQKNVDCPFCRQKMQVYGTVSKCTYCNTFVKYGQVVGKEPT